MEVLWGEGISYFGVSARLRRGLADFPRVAPGTKSVRTSGDRASTGIENSSQNGALTLQSLLRGIQSPEPAKSQGDSRLRVHLPSSEATGMPKRPQEHIQAPQGTQRGPENSDADLIDNQAELHRSRKAWGDLRHVHQPSETISPTCSQSLQNNS